MDPITTFLNGIVAGHGQAAEPKYDYQEYTKPGRRAAHHRQVTQEEYASWYPVHHSGQRMIASFYGHGEHLSRYTASGQRFNPHAHTAAHRTLPFGTQLRVCHNGCTVVTVNDRGPFARGRSLDLSYGAARAIGMSSTSAISVERLN